MPGKAAAAGWAARAGSRRASPMASGEGSTEPAMALQKVSGRGRTAPARMSQPPGAL